MVDNTLEWTLIISPTKSGVFAFNKMFSQESPSNGNKVGSADVLISVYAAERAAYLDACLASITRQASQINRIILIKDGPLSTALDAIIDAHVDQQPDLFRIISFPENRGLTTALNEGLEKCTSDYVLRMDSDDIAMEDRFRRQIEFMDTHPDTGVLSAAMYEFDEQPVDAKRLKPVLVDHAEISKQFVYRNPINHPAVCFRTELVKRVGGYPDLQYLEDYFLWCKLLIAGAQFHNLPEPLQYYRFNRGTISRRGGWQNLRNECRVRWYLYKHDAAGVLPFLFAILAQLILRLAPDAIRAKVWQLSRQSVHKE